MSRPADSPDTESSRCRQVRAFVSSVGLAFLIGAVVYQGQFPGGLVVVLPLGGVPLLGYLAWVKSATGSIVAGVALLGVIIGTALYVTGRMEAGSSTAGVGWLYLLVIGLPVLGTTIVVEMLFDGRRPDSAS